MEETTTKKAPDSGGNQGQEQGSCDTLERDAKEISLAPGNVKAAALALAERGKPVFPCSTDKKPKTAHGLKDASTDPEQIKAWWDKWPGASLAMATGPAAGVWVLDVDLPDGPGTLARLEQENGPLPPTLEQQTGGGGRQLFFQWNGQEIGNTARKIGPGLDTRGAGGYVILPPSGHPSGGRYQWRDVAQKPAPAPSWLVDLVTKQKERQTAPERPRGASPGGSAYGRAALEREAGAVALAHEGTRNDTLNRAAFCLFQLVAAGELDGGEVESVLMEAAQRCGLDHAGAAKTLASGRAAGLREPREKPVSAFVTFAKNKRGTPETSSGNSFRVSDVCDVSPEENEKCTALPPAPLHLFHSEVAHILEQVAQAKGCPVEAAMAAHIAACAGLIGRKRKLRIKQGWSERGNLYLALIARSGIGKSPGTKFFFKPIHELEKSFQLTFQAKYEDYEEKLSEWTKESKKKGGKPGKKPLPPQREDILVDDWTTESLTDALAANPRGILAYRDELAGLFLELDKYAGQTGGTKNRFMEAYDSGPWKTSRINKARISYIPNACLSIYGTIQPIQAKEIFTGKDKATGFLARFILINASQKAPSFFNMKSEDERAKDTWKRLVSGLYSLPFDEEEDLRNMIDCTNEAREHFAKWHDDLETEKWLGEDDSEDSMLSKLRGQCLRLALHLHLVDCILDRKDNMTPLSIQTMQRACLLTDWIKAHARAAWNILKGSAALPTGQEIRVGKAILALVDQIKDGLLLTSLITAQANKGLEKRFHLSARAVGKTCSKLGLEKKDSGKDRGWTVTPEDVARLKTILETNVTNVTNAEPRQGKASHAPRFENANVTNAEDVEVF